MELLFNPELKRFRITGEDEILTVRELVRFTGVCIKGLIMAPIYIFRYKLRK